MFITYCTGTDTDTGSAVAIFTQKQRHTPCTTNNEQRRYKWKRNKSKFYYYPHLTSHKQHEKISYQQTHASSIVHLCCLLRILVCSILCVNFMSCLPFMWMRSWIFSFYTYLHTEYECWMLNDYYQQLWSATHSNFQLPVERKVFSFATKKLK